MKDEDVFIATFQPSAQEKVQIYGIFRQDFAEIMSEKEDTSEVWTGKFGTDFVEKINSKFETHSSVKTLLARIGKALGVGCSDTLIDWLTPADLQSLAEQNGKSGSSNENDEKRVLVMIETSGEKKINIPFALNYGQYPSPESFMKIIRKLKNPAQKKQQDEGLFLTNTNTTGSTPRHNAELQSLIDENAALKAEIQRLKNASKKHLIEEPSSRLHTGDEKRALQSEIRQLRKALNESEIEASIIPTLKKQLKEKLKEVEILNMYVREVEICSKIRAPIPNYNSYKTSMSSSDTHEREADGKNPAGRILPYNPNKKMPGLQPQTQGHQMNTNKLGRNKTSHQPTRDTANIQSLGMQDPKYYTGFNPQSASRSNSRGSNKYISAPKLAKAPSIGRLPGYQIDYRFKPKSSSKGSRGGSRGNNY